ncbi:MAG: hypothetical protein ACLFQ6_08760 [Candidatus Sumerlaeia bacterium]
MRNLSSLTQTESQKQSQDVVYVAAIDWPDETVWYAHRPVALQDRTIPANLIDSGKMQSSAPTSIGPARHRLEQRLELTLALDGPETNPVRERLASIEPEGLAIRWGIVFQDAAGLAATDDIVWLFSGTIRQCRMNRLGLKVECLDLISSRRDMVFGRERSANELPEANATTGRMLPWIFGKAGTVPLLEWRVGELRKTARVVSPDDKVIYLESTEGLPPKGMVQLEDELISYESVDYVNHTLSTTYLPLSRPESAPHPAGSLLRVKPSGGFEWIVSEHACHTLDHLRGDGRLLDAGSWSSATESRLNETVQKITMQRYPCQVEYRDSTSTLKMDGRSYANLWTVDSATTALSAANAVDAFDRETAATLQTPSNRLLKLEWQRDLSDGERRYGLLAGARMVMRMKTNAWWESNTRLWMRFEKKGLSRSAAFPQPAPGVVETYALDLSELVEAEGWNLFEDGLDACVASLEFETLGDSATVEIFDLVLEIDYYARSRARMVDALTIEAEGLAENDVLLENPVEILRFLLTDAHAFGIDSDKIDDASLNDAAQILDAKGYCFSSRLASPVALGSLLDRLLFESRLRLLMDGETVRVQVDEGMDEWTVAAMELDADMLLNGDALELVREDEASLLKAVRLHYGRDFSGNHAPYHREAMLVEAFPPPLNHGASGREWADRLHWHNQGDAVPVQDLARHLMNVHGFRGHRLSVSAPLAAIGLLPWDRVDISEGYFPLELRQGHVEVVAIEQPHRMEIATHFDLGGRICWEEDATTFIRHRMSNRLLEYWIEGRLVSTVRWDGRWRLRGEVVEMAELDFAMDEAIVFSPSEDRIYFGTGSGTSYTPRFALDASGRLLVAGMVVEDLAWEEILMLDCLEVSGLIFAKGLADTVPVHVFDVMQNRLFARGVIVEDQDFD